MKDEAQDKEYSQDGEYGALAILYDLVIEQILKRAPHQGEALDVASGSGQLLARLAYSLPNVRFLGTDVSDHMLNIASKKSKKLNLTNVSFLKQDMYQLGELVRQKKKFDLITWTLALHHCEFDHQVIQVLDSLKLLLKDTGSLIIFDINRPKTGRIAVKFADEFNNRQGSWFYQDSLDSYKAAFTFNELGRILKKTQLENYEHFRPIFADFFQFIRITKTKNEKYIVPKNLKFLWQKMDLFLLKINLLGKF